MKVKDAMHVGAFWVGPDTSLTDIAKLMEKNDIGAVPIGENDQLVGMVTDPTSSTEGWQRRTSMCAARRRAM